MKNHDLLRLIKDFKNMAEYGIFNSLLRMVSGYPPIIAQLEELGAKWNELPDNDLTLEQEYLLGQMLFSDEAQEMQDENVFFNICQWRQHLWGYNAGGLYEAYRRLQENGLLTPDCARVVRQHDNHFDAAQILGRISAYFDIDKAYLQTCDLPINFFYKATDFICALESLSRAGVIRKDDPLRDQIGRTLLDRGNREIETYQAGSEALIKLHEKHVPFTFNLRRAFLEERNLQDFVKACVMLHEKGLLNDTVLSTFYKIPLGVSLQSCFIELDKAGKLNERTLQRALLYPDASDLIAIEEGNKAAIRPRHMAEMEKLGFFATPVTTAQEHVSSPRPV